MSKNDIPFEVITKQYVKFECEKCGESIELRLRGRRILHENYCCGAQYAIWEDEHKNIHIQRKGRLSTLLRKMRW